jgi:uncharacterized repeat protein (TIGR01451 family)
MRTLTDVFTPGAPSLPEGLRTLAVSPERELEPGMTVRASFTFRNQGGAAASGVRVRFNMPEGLVYLVGTGMLDGALLDDEHGTSPLLSRAGADIGDVAPGDERRIDIAYSVAGAIENGSTIEMQAAVTAFELPPVGSNIVRLVARSRPALQNALTGITIESRQHEPRAGGEATITVRVHNAGESSAHDVVVVAPPPEHTSYVPNSARVNGRELERDLLAAFDKVHAPVIVATLPASATATLQYRVRIHEPLPSGTAVAARAEIASQETAAFAVEPAALTITSRADFEDERTALIVEPESDAAPGAHVVFRLTAFNAGTTAAHDASVTFEFPAGLLTVRGAASLDGHPLRERKGPASAFEIGTIGAGERVEVVAQGVLAAPLADGTQLRPAAVLRFGVDGSDQQSERRFERVLTVRSKPFLSPRRNRIERAGSLLAHPSDEIEAVITLANDGSAAAHDTVLEVHADSALDDVRVFEKNARLDLANGAVELGTLEAYAARKLTLRARVRTPYADGSDVQLAATLHSQELGEFSLGAAHWRVDSHPAFSAHGSSVSLVEDDVFRPNQLVEVVVRLRNEGTDSAHNVRLRLYVSPEARLETVDGATRERSTLAFGEVAPGAVVEARLGVRLLRSLAKANPVTIESVLTADAMLPVQLASLAIVTTAEPNFAIGTLRSQPQEIADAGEEIEFVLHVRNSGDGPARKARVSIEPLDMLIYVPNSTSVNDLAVRDAGAASPLMHERGLVMSDVDPGIEATIRWREVVKTTTPSGTVIRRSARISYDGERTDDVAADEVTVRCAPAFANTIAGLPFGLDGLPGPVFGSAQRALASSEFLELPRATPVARPAEIAPRAVLSLAAVNGSGHARPGGEEQTPADPDTAHVLVAFDRDRLERTMRFLSEARFSGLVTHLFALRAFFPDAAGGQTDRALHELRETLRESLDRIYIKLRVPNYVLAPRDVETAAARNALEALLDGIEPGMLPPERAGSVVLRGSVHQEELHTLRDRLGAASLATALPWAILARLLPNSGEVLSNYASMLAGELDDLAGADETAFIDALQRRPYPVLDAALDVVRTQLLAVRA